MTTWKMRWACAALLIAPLAFADKTADKTEAVFVNAAELQWGPAPPELPKGAQVAVLHGDPFKPGMFVMRLKVPAGYQIPPHWHTQHEQLTILSGTLILHMGDTMKAEPHELGPQAFHFLPGGMHHAAEAKGGEVVVQIAGVGPFDIHYVNAADNPARNPKSARR